MSSGVALFTSDRLTIDCTVVKQLYTLMWIGECDFRNPTQTLGPTLSGLLPELYDRKLVLDFRKLTFMNSSSVAPVLAFIKAACSKKVPVHLIYTATLSWQRTSASSMRSLVRALKHLTVEIESPADSPP